MKKDNSLKVYEVGLVDIEESNVYYKNIKASDIEDAYNIAFEKRVNENDRIISIIEQM